MRVEVWGRRIVAPQSRSLADQPRWRDGSTGRADLTIQDRHVPTGEPTADVDLSGGVQLDGGEFVGPLRDRSERADPVATAATARSLNPANRCRWCASSGWVSTSTRLTARSADAVVDIVGMAWADVAFGCDCGAGNAIKSYRQIRRTAPRRDSGHGSQRGGGTAARVRCHLICGAGRHGWKDVDRAQTPSRGVP